MKSSSSRPGKFTLSGQNRLQFCLRGMTIFLRSIFLQSIAIALFLDLSFAGSAAAAPICRSVNGQEICILSIQRSAKNYWEYRVSVRIDGETRSWRPGTVSIEKYNCRDRIRIGQDGRAVPFEPQGAGELICRLAHQKGR